MFQKLNDNIVSDKIRLICNSVLNSPATNNGLLTGQMGRILLLQSLYLYSNEEKYLSKSEELLEIVFEDLTNPNSNFYQNISFSSGLAGLSFLITTLQKEGCIELDIEDQLGEIDEILFNTALQQINDNQNDFLLGSIGIIYALSQRSSNEKVVTYLQALIDTLSENAIKSTDGTRFLNYLISPDHGMANFSLSHGMSGVALVLIDVYEKDIRQSELRELITSIINYMLSHRQKIDFDKNKISYFPSGVKDSSFDNTEVKSSRLAWCYGDLNQVLLLYKAGLLFDKLDWLELADEIGANTLKRTKQQYTGVVDAYFCHGTAGLAQYYKSLFELTKNPGYKKAYLDWILETINTLNQSDHYDTNGILEGHEGIALVLLSVLKPEISGWQKTFLL